MTVLSRACAAINVVPAAFQGGAELHPIPFQCFRLNMKSRPSTSTRPPEIKLRPSRRCKQRIRSVTAGTRRRSSILMRHSYSVFIFKERQRAIELSNLLLSSEQCWLTMPEVPQVMILKD